MKVHFIIPYHKAEKTIAECLNSIYDQELPSNYKITEYKITVVRNGCLDILDHFENKSTKIVKLKNKSRSRARNIALTDHESDFFAFIDADVVLEKNWLVSTIDRFISTSIAAINTRVKRVGSNNLLKYRLRISDETTNYTNDTMRGSAKFNTLNTAALMVRAKSFHSVGGFDERAIRNEDFELTLKFQFNGWVISSSFNSIAYVYWSGGLIDYYLVKPFLNGFFRKAVLCKYNLAKSLKKKDILFEFKNILFGKIEFGYKVYLIIIYIGFVLGECLGAFKKIDPLRNRLRKNCETNLYLKRGRYTFQINQSFLWYFNEKNFVLTSIETFKKYYFSGNEYKLLKELLIDQSLTLNSSDKIIAFGRLKSIGVFRNVSLAFKEH